MDFQKDIRKLLVVSVTTNGDEHFPLLFFAAKIIMDLPSGINSVGLLRLAELLSYCDYIYF